MTTILTVELRKKCNVDCGFDKGITFSVDVPITIQELLEAIKLGKKGFSPHNHRCEITETITLFPSEEEV